MASRMRHGHSARVALLRVASARVAPLAPRPSCAHPIRNQTSRLRSCDAAGPRVAPGPGDTPNEEAAMTHRSKPITITRTTLAVAMLASGALGVGVGELAAPLQSSQAHARIASAPA